QVLIQSGGNTPWRNEDGQQKTIPYWLLVVAGLGVFAGCVGKSAQFPLQTWLPDAMEGPTPVSALVHSATMVAAGVYLVGRFYPVFTPEVLLTIAYVGCLTAFIGATIAIVVTDIKRVLAYSTISQLGYMMLALGVGGWMAGLFHLITHAFFKSLMFLCSGSVIHGCHHEQDMTRMGGLRHKMPFTAYTMLIGVFAISGYGIPNLPIWLQVNFSGFYSKDAIIASALSYVSLNPQHFLLFYVPVVTAGITAFYMFRMWFMTFAGTPRDQHVHEHAHESPLAMVAPLVVLSIFAWFCAYGGEEGGLVHQILSSEPAHVNAGLEHGTGHLGLALPSHHEIHDKHPTAGWVALFAAGLGSLISYLFYCRRTIDAGIIGRQFWVIRDFLIEKWRFDELYDVVFVRPVHIVGRWAQAFDKAVLDGLIHLFGRLTVTAAHIDRSFDERVVDRIVNVCGEVTYSAGRSLKGLQTGRLRQYVMFIALGVVSLFVLVFAFLPRS
ncbi:MAG: NADH-quinone oxidoreductase subunit L, partial [Planctomycetota bacterium]